ncbi:MAG: hypothetical protein ACLFQM_07765 [Fidelibacterota bacterium]
MKRIYFIVLISFSLLSQLFARDSTARVDTLNPKNIYEQLYQTASKDQQIKSEERAMLRSLQRSLELTKFQVRDIENRLNVSFQNVLDQSGRWPLVIQNVAWGAGLYGWGIPVVLNIRDDKWFVASELMSFAGAFYLSHRYTKNMDIPHSRAQMMRMGSGVGFHYGWALTKLMKLDYDSGNENRLILSMLMASVPAGIWAGDRLNSRWQPTNGQAWAISLAGLIANASATNLHKIAEEKPREPDWPEPIFNEETHTWEYMDYDEFEHSREYKQYKESLAEWEQRQAIVTLLAYPAGLYLGEKFLGDREYTFGDAVILYQGYGVGMFYALMAMDILYAHDLNPEDNLFQFSLLAGGLAGTYCYDRMISGHDYSFGESLLLGVGTVSGSAFGAAIGVIVEADVEIIELGMILGGITGTYLTKKILSPEKESLTTIRKDNLSVSLNPDFKFLKGNHKPTIATGLNLQINF